MSWAIRPILPEGAGFKGQLVYPVTHIEIPSTLKKYVESVTAEYPDYYVVKHTGFDSKKYKIKNATGTDVEALVTIYLTGDIPRWLKNLFVSLATACNGAGLPIDFYDDWATGKQYSGRWENAGDFVNTTAILSGGNIEISAYKVQAI